MEKNSVKKMVSKVITKAGMKSARVDFNQACVYVLYQPQKPNKNSLMTKICVSK